MISFAAVNELQIELSFKVRTNSACLRSAIKLAFKKMSSCFDYLVFCVLDSEKTPPKYTSRLEHCTQVYQASLKRVCLSCGVFFCLFLLKRY